MNKVSVIRDIRLIDRKIKRCKSWRPKNPSVRQSKSFMILSLACRRAALVVEIMNMCMPDMSKFKKLSHF